MAEAFGQQRQLDKVREVPLIHVAGNRGLATGTWCVSLASAASIGRAADITAMTDLTDAVEKAGDLRRPSVLSCVCPMTKLPIGERAGRPELDREPNPQLEPDRQDVQPQRIIDTPTRRIFADR